MAKTNAEAQVAHFGDIDARTAMLLDLIGEAKTALLVGGRGERVGTLLDARGCDIVGIVSNAVAADEARVFCSAVEIADLNVATLPESLSERTFDAAIFEGTLCQIAQPSRLLDRTRHLLAAGGHAIAVIPNVTYGAFRLRVLKGEFEVGPHDDAFLGAMSRQDIVALFEGAGFEIELLERIVSPLGATVEQLNGVGSTDFASAIIEHIQEDPECDTASFVVRAAPKASARSGAVATLGSVPETAALRALLARTEQRLADLERGAELPEVAVRTLALAASSPNLVLLGSELDAAHARVRELEAAIADTTEHDALLASLQSQVAADAQTVLELQADLAHERGVIAERDSQVLALQADLAHERGVVAALETALERACAAHNAIEVAAARLESDWFEIYAELERVNATHATESETLRKHIAGLSDTIDLVKATGRATTERLQGRLDEAEQLRDAAFAQNEGLRLELSVLKVRLAELSTTLDERDAELREELWEAQRLANAYRTLESEVIAHETATLAKHREELDEVSIFTHSIHSGKFWAAKNVLRKIRGLFTRSS